MVLWLCRPSKFKNEAMIGHDTIASATRGSDLGIPDFSDWATLRSSFRLRQLQESAMLWKNPLLQRTRHVEQLLSLPQQHVMQEIQLNRRDLTPQINHDNI